jgi:hypothetical protein
MKKIISLMLVLCLLAVTVHAVTGGNSATKQKTSGKDRPAIIVLRHQMILSTDISASALIIKGNNGTEQKLILAKETRITKKGKEILLSDISAGDHVSVYFKNFKDGRTIPSTIRVLAGKSETVKPSK